MGEAGVSLLALLPLAALGALCLALGNRFPTWGWGRAFLRSLVLVGAYLGVGTEGLSVARWVTPAGLSAFWLAPALASAGYLLVRRRRGEKIVWPALGVPPAWGGRVLLGVVGVVLILTALVAWLAPPQTWDSLTYHTARVAHWAQNRSLAHYATGIERQNLMSPGAETGVLHGYVLAGSDRLANFVEWGAMVASLIGAAVVAGQLGAGSTGRLFAAALLATLPTGIVQATSTMTDYVVAMWMICVASEALTVVRDPRVAPELGYLATAAGLAILSKPTAFGFLLPFALLVAFVLLRREGLGRMLLAAGGATLVVAALNAGYFTRNLVTYGHPLGDWRNLERNGNQGSLLGTIFSNTLRNASLHAGTPWEAVNHQLWRLVVGTHFKLGLDVNDPNRSIEADFRILRPRPSELRTGSLLHAVLAVFVVTLVAVQAARRRWPDSGLRVYTLVVAVSFVTFSSSMKFSVFADRYHMPFFVLMAPLIAAVLDRLCRAWVLAAMAVGLLAYSWPWLARLEPRPLFPRKDGVSILDTDRMDLYFSATSTETTELLRDTIQGNACQVVGVMLGGDSPEYPLWAFLGAPRSGVRLEWIVAGTPSARYAPVDFQPCAVVCDQSCPSEWTTVRDLPLRLDVSGIRLFMAP